MKRITVKDLNINGHDLMEGFHLKLGRSLAGYSTSSLKGFLMIRRSMITTPSCPSHREIMGRLKGEEEGAES
jgi:hypothetical protein